MIESLFENCEYTQEIAIVSIRQVKEGSLSYGEIHGPDDICKLLENYLENKDREHFVCLSLSRKGQINNITTVSIGTLYSAAVSPREAFKTAIISNAASIIVAHNHPTGDITPSKEDKAITEQLVKAGEILGIEVLDHVIVGDGSYFSFRGHGLM